MRGASNRANQLLESEFGNGIATTTLALALGHACYPIAIYGDNGIHDEIVKRLKNISPRPCAEHMACQYVEAWLDKGTLSTLRVFYCVWGMDPYQFLQRAFEAFGEESLK